ncbi:hypothetical protein REPUB_Repub05bG0173000 [Reevesia pubescens]
MATEATKNPTQQTKLRWGELDEDGAGDLDFLLPPKQVIGPDENGIKKVIEYKFNDEGNKVAGDPLAQLGKGGAVLMVCRTCGKKGDHWTSRCPYKDLAPPTEGFVDKPATAAAGSGKSTYVPPGMRAGAERSRTDMRRRNDENSVRVTNLSEDTREPDLLELFRSFGAVSRVHVAFDQKTGMSRGFGFVNFVSKEDAQKAINKLNGYGYDNLILRVEWATQRAN